MGACRAAARFLALVCFSVGAFSCGERGRAAPPAAEGEGLHVVVSIPPLKGLIEPLLGEDGTIDVLVGPGSSVHGWEPRPRDVGRLAGADLVVLVGLGLEPAIERALAAGGERAPPVLVFADAAGMTPGGDGHDHGEHAHGEHDHGDHDHADHDHPHDGHAHDGHEHDDHAHDGHEHDGHDHGPVDPHLWLDPALAADLARAAAGHLERAHESAGRAAQGAQVRERLDALLRRIDELDAEHRRRLAPFAGAALAADHAAWARLLERYGLRLATVVRPIAQVEPRPGQVARVVEAINEQGVEVLIVEPQWSGRAARQVADATGVRLASLDPLGDGDWFALMRANLDALASALEGEG